MKLYMEGKLVQEFLGLISERIRLVKMLLLIMSKEFIDYHNMLIIWSSRPPNTPELRQLQGRRQLKDLVNKVQGARDEMQWAEEGPPPLLVKIAPDLSKQDLEDIARIISNTTIQRHKTISNNPVPEETGGLSGKPLFDLSSNILKEMYILSKGKIRLIGCGGICSGEDAYKKIRAGATLVQLYTAFAYGGPALIHKIKAELAQYLEGDGVKSIYEAVGADSTDSLDILLPILPHCTYRFGCLPFCSKDFAN